MDRRVRIITDAVYQGCGKKNFSTRVTLLKLSKQFASGHRFNKARIFAAIRTLPRRRTARLTVVRTICGRPYRECSTVIRKAGRNERSLGGGTEPLPESKPRLWNKLSLGGAKSRGLSVGGRTRSWSRFLLMCACVCVNLCVCCGCKWASRFVAGTKMTVRRTNSRKAGEKKERENTYLAMMLVGVSLLCATRRLVCHRPKRKLLRSRHRLPSVTAWRGTEAVHRTDI